MEKKSITRVTNDDIKKATKIDDYLYDFRGPNRLLKCPFEPYYKSEYDFIGRYEFSGVSIICDNACSGSWLSLFDTISIELPNGITHIGDYAFMERNLHSVELPESLIYIGEAPFALTSPFNLRSKSSKYTVNNDCLIDVEKESIIHNVSYNGTIEIPNNIKRIENYSFSRLKGTPNNDSFYRNLFKDEIDEYTLTVIIPGSIEYLGNNAFENCNIRNVIFLSTPKLIGKDVFKDCPVLEKIHVPYGEGEKFASVFPEVKDKIDSTGDAVMSRLQCNLLAEHGITNFFKIYTEENKNIYGYIKNDKFHFSDENGIEMDRDVYSDNKIIVFRLFRNSYTEVKSGSYIYEEKGDFFAIDKEGNIFNFSSIDNYIRLDDGDILVHSHEGEEMSSNYQQKGYFIGDKQNISLSTIDSFWSYYKENKGYKIINRKTIYPESYDEVKPYSVNSGGLIKAEVILVKKNDLWGWYNNKGIYFEPKYTQIVELSYELLYAIAPNGYKYLLTFDNKIIIGGKSININYTGLYSYCSKIVLAYDSDRIITFHIKEDAFRISYSGYDYKLKNPNDQIVEADLTEFRNNYNYKVKTFIVVKLKSGKEEYYDEYCNKYNMNGWDWEIID